MHEPNKVACDFAGVMAFWFTLLASFLLCTLFWENFVNGTLYNCTDPGFIDFWDYSTNWVHHPVAALHVTDGRSMSEPDLIKVGWTIGRLNCLRWSFVVGCVAVSVISGVFVCRFRMSRFPVENDR